MNRRDLLLSGVAFAAVAGAVSAQGVAALPVSVVPVAAAQGCRLPRGVLRPGQQLEAPGSAGP